jgi:hypothetical protein
MIFFASRPALRKSAVVGSAVVAEQCCDDGSQK